MSYAQGDVLAGRHNSEERLRVIEDRGEEVVVERFGRVHHNQHHGPLILTRAQLEIVFEATGESRGPTTDEERREWRRPLSRRS